MPDRISNPNFNLFKHIATGQIHKVITSFPKDNDIFIITLQTNLLSLKPTHSWLGPRDEFGKQFETVG
jgi:hypothetical protein